MSKAAKLFAFAIIFTSVTWAAAVIEGEDIEIPLRPLRQKGLLDPRFRYDNNERSTSNSSDLWERAGLYLLEWPGNVTQMDANFPLVKWGQDRARYLQSPCEKERGMELAVYAYKHLHLTWGANRLTRSYCEPLRLRRNHLPMAEWNKKDFEITVIDFAFVFDALLVITKQGYLVRLGNIELTYANVPRRVRYNLTYSLPEGIGDSKVSRLVAQKCCSKSKGSCAYGDTILAHDQFNNKVFISYDGGHKFGELALKTQWTMLQAILFYPNYRRILAFYGSSNQILYGIFSSVNGSLLSNNHSSISTQGAVLQAYRINNEHSFLMWDQCSLWYGLPNFAQNVVDFVKAKFYMHNSIIQSMVDYGRRANIKSHLVTRSHCHLGKDALLAIGEHKFGLLDAHNNFLYGIDSKSTVDFKLVALATDMSLLFAQHAHSISPAFDRNNRPKLVYPPRYLRIPQENIRGENYEQRLAMRILKKTLFPSDFMQPFFSENLPIIQSQKVGISHCQGSYLSIDGSISQKPKRYTLGLHSPLYFEIVFQSRSNSTEQLAMSPAKDIHSLAHVSVQAVQATRMSGGRYWFKYQVRMALRASYDMGDGNTFLVTFHTPCSLRCVHQPMVQVWVTLDKDFRGNPPSSVQSSSQVKSKMKGTTCQKTAEDSELISPCKEDMDTLTKGTCLRHEARSHATLK